MLVPGLALKIMVPASLIFIIGLVDDFYELGARAKFAVQTAAAILLSCDGLGISHLSILQGHPHWGRVAGLALTILWVLWITNAFNLIDGLDGLAAGIALLATVFSGIVALLDGNHPVLFLAVALIGAIAGFLRYNFNPASIFLGDCGSLVIGFLLSGIAIADVQKSGALVAVVFPVVCLGLPILDLGVAVLRRYLGGKPLFDADREHIHHKLLGLSLSHRQAVLVLYGVSAGFGVCSLLLVHPHRVANALVVIAVGLGVCLGVLRLRYPEFLELGRAAGRMLRQRRVIANGSKVRRAVDILDSCSNLPQFCQALKQCLEPIGFDGFGLHLASGMPLGSDTQPLKRISGSKLQYFWNRTPSNPDTNWSLTIPLSTGNGNLLGGFSLYRMDATAPLFLDVDSFVATGFSMAVGTIVEKLQSSGLEKIRNTQRLKPAYRTPAPAVASKLRRPIALPHSGLPLNGNNL